MPKSFLNSNSSSNVRNSACDIVFLSSMFAVGFQFHRESQSPTCSNCQSRVYLFSLSRDERKRFDFGPRLRQWHRVTILTRRVSDAVSSRVGNSIEYAGHVCRRCARLICSWRSTMRGGRIRWRRSRFRHPSVVRSVLPFDRTDRRSSLVARPKSNAIISDVSEA